MPLSVDDTAVVRGEVGEQGRGQVKTTVRASWALLRRDKVSDVDFSVLDDCQPTWSRIVAVAVFPPKLMETFLKQLGPGYPPPYC